MNKQSNTYTIIYIVVLVAIVGASLAFTSLALKDRQTQNADADKMSQILAAAHIAPNDSTTIQSLYATYIRDSFIVNTAGQRIPGDAFDVDVAKQSKEKDATKRLLPVYVLNTNPTTNLPENDKYILPVYGSGLWGPIWGYVAVDADGSTIYGAFFAHQGETPGLGAEIQSDGFLSQFNPSLHMFKDGKFLPISVVKKGQDAPNGADKVDAVSGGTITSKGVAAMLDNCLTPYQSFLQSLNK